MEWRALLMEYRVLLIEHRALLIIERDVFVTPYICVYSESRRLLMVS